MPMPASPPDSPAASTVCARCGAQTGGGLREGSCAACMVTDFAGGEWSDLLTPGGTEMVAGGGFTVLEEIGRGGMGIVYRARQRSPEREVALKLLPPSFSTSGDVAQRLLAEAAMLAELDHPGILPLFASGVQDGRPWLAMKLASGGTLAARQPEWQGRWRACAELAAGLADAVQHAHERGLIHRDLKPGNILFDEAGRAYVADFGLGKWRDRDSSLTHTNTVLGTPAYMAPEVARADGRVATTASDVYGLGAVLYFVLCGQPPYAPAGTLEMLRRIAEEDPVPPRQKVPGLPGDLQVICLKALARQPAHRYSGPDAFAADLRRWLAGDAIEARPASRSEKVRRWVRRHPLSAGLAALLAVTVAGSGGMLWQKNRALTEALDDAQQNLHAAYSSMGYVTREIPPQLDAVGRLEVLDGLFHYVENRLVKLRKSVRQLDSADLVYQAELYAHWSRVLRWRGQYAAAREKITRAVRLAGEAVQGRDPAPLAWAVQSMAHRLLAEQFTDDEDFASGFPELEKARAAALAGIVRFPTDIPLRVEEAEVAHQRCDSRWSERNATALEQAALEATVLWAALRPAVEAADVNPSMVRQWRQRSPMPIYYLSASAEWSGDRAAAVAYARALLREREAQLAQSLESNDHKHEAALACNLLARLLLGQTSDAPREEILPLLDRADELSSKLVQTTDPQNQEWRAEWGSVALTRGLALNSDEWRRKCLERLDPVKDSTKAYIQELRVAAREELAKSAATAEQKTRRWEECMKDAERLAASRPPRWANFESLIYAQKKVAEHLTGDPAQRESNARAGIAAARTAGESPDASPFWAAVEASWQRRLADVLAADPARMEEAREANRNALKLRADILSSASLRARQYMIGAVEGTCTELLKIAPVSASDANLVLKQLTALAPGALAAGPSRDWREHWVSAADLALPALPKPERAAADAALLRALYTDEELSRLARRARP
jgi:hypothetical protein